MNCTLCLTYNFKSMEFKSYHICIFVFVNKAHSIATLKITVHFCCQSQITGLYHLLEDFTSEILRILIWNLLIFYGVSWNSQHPPSAPSELTVHPLSFSLQIKMNVRRITADASMSASTLLAATCVSAATALYCMRTNTTAKKVCTGSRKKQR